MTIDDEVATMRRIPMLAKIEPKPLRMLAAVCRRVVFAPGQVVFEQGDEGDAAYVILSGSAAIIARSGSGDTIIATTGPDTLVGELAVICDVARSATVRAETTLVTLRIERDHFMELLRQSPEASAAVMRHIGLRLIERTDELAATRRGDSRN